jgi:hypothetical protein
MKEDPAKGFGFYDDFTKGGLITSPTAIAALVGANWTGFSDTGGAITYADELGGGLKLASDGTDNDSMSMYSNNHIFKMGLSNEPFWFEASIKASALLTTESGFFLGINDSTAKTTDVPLVGASAGALADLNLVGFHALDTDIGVVKSCYKSDGVTAVDVQSSAAATVVEGEYIKLGFKKGLDGYVRWFIDNVEMTTKFKVLNDLGTGFPGDILMAPIMTLAVGAATGAQTLHCRWISCWQLHARGLAV